PHVAVVGGGFAGLAAAVRLARGGARVTLLERRPFLGGRAYSFTDPATGDVVDNGPHALMGAYAAALDFLAEIGAGSKLAFQRRLHVALADPALGLGAVAAPPLPGPLQAPAALLRYRLLAPGDRVRLLVGAVRLAARAPASLAGTTVAAALARVGQRGARPARREARRGGRRRARRSGGGAAPAGPGAAPRRASLPLPRRRWDLADRQRAPLARPPRRLGRALPRAPRRPRAVAVRLRS